MRVFLTTGAVILLAVAARGQALPSAPCTNASKCTTAPAAAPKSPAQQFPFPGEEPSTASRPADVAPDAPTAPSAAASPQTAKPNAPPAYPGDPDAKSDSPASSSSSSASGYDPTAGDDDPGALTDAGSSGDSTAPGHSRRRKLPKVAAETPESRAAEDLTVADFYSKSGNYAAAYLRAKDAVQYAPDDPYAHFALAEAAFKLDKKDEAREHYTQVLKLDPIPKQSKASQRALELLGPAAK